MMKATSRYARIEYERRWLVDRAARPQFSETAATVIYDRYIIGSRLRLRQVDYPGTGPSRYKLARKELAPDPSARPVTNLYLTPEEHALLASLPASAIVKRRQHILHHGRLWSLDSFDGALSGLEILECETDSAEQLAALDPPTWVLREVTHLAQWQSGALAAHGIPED
jgi:CYTH domain-containing protein